MYNPNDKKHTSWIDVPAQSDFPIQNIPFGIFKTSTKTARCATRIGDTVIDLYELAKADVLTVEAKVFNTCALNAFMALGKAKTSAVRQQLSEFFNANNSEASQDKVVKTALHAIEDVEMLLPAKIGDYTDFYSSIDHATNVGKLFRDPANALMPNWKHLPVGYHGRSSSIVVSGTDIYRPKGQIKPKDADKPFFSDSKRMDFEVEMAFITGQSTALGDSISTAKAEDYIFGFVLFNDLSARDIQGWEYVPLGPFLGKNFGSVISPWIVTIEALEPFRVAGEKQEPEVLDYLKYEGLKNFDVKLDMYIQPEGEKPSLVCETNFKHMYWNVNQQLAHQTVNGCNINVGDMYASGTISGPTENAFGSMLELSWGGSKEVTLENGGTRKFIEDNDTMIFKGYAEKDGLRIGFGECVTKILPAK